MYRRSRSDGMNAKRLKNKGKYGSKRKKHSRRIRNCESLGAMFNWFLPCDSIFSKLGLHGNTKWLPKSLACLALVWAFSESRNVTDAFTEAMGCCAKLSISKVPNTYQGFMGAIAKWTPELNRILWSILQLRMAEIGGKFWRFGRWVPIAFDGSRNTTPRTKANEKAFCAPNYGKGKTAKYRKKKTKGLRRRKIAKNKTQPPAPQTWVTMLWHMGLRLPWSWQLGPSSSSERGHVMELVENEIFPKFTLFCGDAGFVGYLFWKCIVDRGHDFLVRVGGNVSLLSEANGFKKLKGGIVLCWPKTMIKSKQPPLRLRLVKVCIGKTQMFMLTSILSPAILTPSQIIKLYKMRWGIEVYQADCTSRTVLYQLAA